MTSNNYSFWEITLRNEKQTFKNVEIDEDHKGFLLSYYLGIQTFYHTIQVSLKPHEKCVLSVQITPCKKMLAVIVQGEGNDTPPKKLVRYVAEYHGLVELEINPDNLRLVELEINPDNLPTQISTQTNTQESIKTIL